MANIIETKTHLLGIDLEKPFPLGFGTLSHLPRVLYQITAEGDSGIINGIGEASIDFPFSNYDAYDVYRALKELDIQGVKVDSNQDRLLLLTDDNIRRSCLEDTPAAYTAFNMAIDDLTGKIESISLLDYYGQTRTGGRALASISFMSTPSSLIEEARIKFVQGFVPKPKVGQSPDHDVKTIVALEQSDIDPNFRYALDFNGQYSAQDMTYILEEVRKQVGIPSRLLFIEQPTQPGLGIDELVSTRNHYRQIIGHDLLFVADESFVNLQDAIDCVQAGIGLNFKIHKVGGLYYCRQIEEEIFKLSQHTPPCMVGGTFPTAIARTYDQQSACVLRSTTLPGDGLEPSTDWFSGDKHLIDGQFNPPVNGVFSPRLGPGLGVNPNWHKIERFIVDDPDQEYLRIRNNQPGTRIKIDLKPGQQYDQVYHLKTGRQPDWNLK